MTIDLDELKKACTDGYVRAVQHPKADLTLYNYTPVCQYEKAWTPTTMACRGLILRSDGRVISRPLPKFFNLTELEAIPDGPYTVTEKLDGSALISYRRGEQLHFATRGSFTSEQAMMGMQILAEKYPTAAQDLSMYATYVLELIRPANRIVVDYGSVKDIVLLAVIHTSTGKEVQLDGLQVPFPKVEQHAPRPIEELVAEERADHKGYVLRWADGTRAKVKHDEYVRLHRILTGTSNVTVWEYLRDGMDFADLLEKVPDEFYQWLYTTVRELKAAQAAIIEEAAWIVRPVIGYVLGGMSRKDAAAIILEHDNTNILFALLDGNEEKAALQAWRLVRPTWTKPFKTGVDV